MSIHALGTALCPIIILVYAGGSFVIVQGIFQIAERFINLTEQKPRADIVGILSDKRLHIFLRLLKLLHLRIAAGGIKKVISVARRILFNLFVVTERRSLSLGANVVLTG